MTFASVTCRFIGQTPSINFQVEETGVGRASGLLSRVVAVKKRVFVSYSVSMGFSPDVNCVL